MSSSRPSGIQAVILGAALAVIVAPMAEAATSGAEQRDRSAASSRSQGSSTASSTPSRSSGGSSQGARSSSSTPTRGTSAPRGGAPSESSSGVSSRAAAAAGSGRHAVPRGPQTAPHTRHLRPSAPPPSRVIIHPHFPSWWHAGWGWGWGWSPMLWSMGWYSQPAAVTYRRPRVESEMGPVRILVSPRSAEVWIDGQQVGVAAEFNGRPDYLWLPEGTYDLALYAPRYRTIHQQITVSQETVMRISYRMERGDSVHPQELVDPSTERRDLRLERDRERREAPPYAAPVREDWRQRPQAPSGQRRDPDLAPAPPPALARGSRAAEELIVEEPIEEVEVRAERLQPAEEIAAFGSLELSVAPDDASVYLDDLFLGTGGELAAAASGVLVEPGERVLQVVRPGYRPEEVTFTARAGQEVTVKVELQRY